MGPTVPPAPPPPPPPPPPTKDPAGELGRILRYWAGNLRHCALTPGDESASYDSEYREVGRRRVDGQAE
ncbi:hypothetical protein [Streptomyces massasporeus]|uniref:hypothetical protein n=1 Tax=Streptomyces massasporeus TaxID=67324 RepID=UPI003F4B872E